MFSKKERFLIRDRIWRATQIKFMYKLKLKRSILNSGLTTTTKKMYIKLYIQQNNASIKKKNVCLLSGENKSVRKFTLVSRFHLNYLGVNNKLQNFKINSW